MKSDENKSETGFDLDISPVKALFVGDIVKSSFMPFPSINANEKDTLAMVLETVDRFLEDKRAEFPEWDRQGKQPDEFVQELRDLGLFGLIVPEEYEGIGLSNAGYSRVLAQSSSYEGT